MGEVIHITDIVPLSKPKRPGYMVDVVCVCGPVSGVPGILLFYDGVPYHFFLMVGPPPPPFPSGILSTLGLRVIGCLSDDEHVCNDAGDEIIHAYMRLLSDSTQT